MPAIKPNNCEQGQRKTTRSRKEGSDKKITFKLE